MSTRRFSRDFQAIPELGDCQTSDQLSARRLADQQPGEWRVWSYTPSVDRQPMAACSRVISGESGDSSSVQTWGDPLADTVILPGKLSI